MKSAKNKAAALFFTAISIFILLIFLSSCALKEVLSGADRITADITDGNKLRTKLSETTEEKSDVSGKRKRKQACFF